MMTWIGVKFIMTKEYISFQHLVDSILISMPDEYPSGYAHFLAQKLIDENKVIIKDYKDETKKD